MRAVSFTAMGHLYDGVKAATKVLVQTLEPVHVKYSWRILKH